MAEELENTQQTVANKPERKPNNNRNGNNRPRRNDRDKRDRREADEFDKRTIDIRTVQKVIAGGRTMSMSALCAVGDKKGRVGIGLGKAKETANAVEKALTEAKRTMINVPIVNGTIPHEIIAKFGASTIKLMPAKEGTGIIAGGAARPILELAGIKNITAKNHGSNSKINTVRATFKALQSLQTAEQIAQARGKKVEDL